MSTENHIFFCCVFVTQSNSLGKAPETSKDNLYFDKKIKMLEDELTEIRKKLIDSETERDQLRSDLDLTRKRSKMNRSRLVELIFIHAGYSIMVN